MKRKKTKFEKFFSFSRHRRRFNANYSSGNLDLDFTNQEKLIVNAGKKIYTHGSSDDLKKHFEELRHEFDGESELCLTHAKIIVLIRRDYKVAKYFQIFRELWTNHSEFLLKNLNSRWLISAVDTFADNSADLSEIQISIMANVFLNTIKLYESERFLVNSENNIDDKFKQKKLDEGKRFELFDGLSVFKFGTDDTLRNMRWRIDKLHNKNLPAKIFAEIFKRAHYFDTVFLRAKKRHKRSKTEWWD